MKSLFWKKIETKKQGKPPKIEDGLTLTYLIDKNQYIHFGNHKSLKSDSVSDNSFQKKTDPKDNQQPTSNSISFSIAKINPSAGSTKGDKATALGAITQTTIHTFNPGNNQWTLRECKGRLPNKRLFHHAWYESPHFFIYGGLGTDKKVLHDMLCLNCETYTWKRFFFLEGPTPRLHSAFCSTDGLNYLIGGVSLPENLLLNDIWSLSFENVVWSSNSLELPGIIWSKVDLSEEGMNMPALKGHSATRVGSEKILVFGGVNQQGQITDTCILIDLEKKIVSTLETKGKRPGPRAFHRMTTIKENIVGLFGGTAGEEKDEYYWSCPNVGGYVPTPRCDFALSANRSDLHSEIMIFGGRISNSKDSFLYILSEIDSAHSEAWGLKEEEDQKRIKFQGYFQDSLAKSTTVVNAKELAAMNTIELQFNEAEKLIREQQKMIGEKEYQFKLIREKNEKLMAQRKEMQRSINEFDKETDEKIKVLTETIQKRKKINAQNQELFDKLKVLLTHERKKRKLLAQKTYSLQDALRKSENFIITVDSFYTKGLKDDLLEGVVNEEALEKLEKKKSDHKTILSSFRDEFDEIYKKEKHLKNEIKAKKTTLSSVIDFKELLKKHLSPDDRTVLDFKD